MAKVDLSSYNLAELKGLQSDIEKEIKVRQQQDVRQAREKILKIAQEMGVSIEELLATGGGRSRKKSGSIGQARYHNPADPTQTWTGRGRHPRWVSEALAQGKTLDDLRI